MIALASLALAAQHVGKFGWRDWPKHHVTVCIFITNNVKVPAALAHPALVKTIAKDGNETGGGHSTQKATEIANRKS